MFSYHFNCSDQYASLDPRCSFGAETAVDPQLVPSVREAEESRRELPSFSVNLFVEVVTFHPVRTGCMTLRLPLCFLRNGGWCTRVF